MRVPETPTPFAQREVAPEITPNVEFETKAPIEAFGGGASAEKANKAFHDLGEETQRVFDEERKKADQIRVQKSTLDLLNYKDGLMNQALDTHGEAAFGMPEKVGQDFDKKLQDMSADLTSNDQRAMFNEKAMQFKAEMTNELARHVNKEKETLDLDTSSALIHNYQTAAAKDPTKADYYANEIKKVLTGDEKNPGGLAQRRGWSAPTLELQTQDALSTLHAGVVNNLLTQGDAKSAKAYLENRKDDLNGETYDRLQQKIQSPLALQISEELWNKRFSGMKLADGSPDETRMRAAVFGEKDLDPEQKRAVWEFTRARAQEDYRMRTQRDNATERAFMDKVIDMRKKGMPQDTALRMASGLSRDQYDETQKQTLVKSIYGPPKETDPQLYETLRSGVLDGTTTKTDLDQALQDGKLSHSDYRTLTDKASKGATDGHGADEKYAESAIKKMVGQNLTDPKEQGQFMIYLDRATEGMTAKDKLDFAAQALKVPGDNNPYKDLNVDWKADLQRQQQDSAQWRGMEKEMGPKVLNAIGQGFSTVRGPGSKWTPKDVKDFMDTFGGPESFRPGQPNYNAVQALIQNGYPVTVDYLHRYLMKYPEGQK